MLVASRNLNVVFGRVTIVIELSNQDNLQNVTTRREVYGSSTHSFQSFCL